MRTRSAVLPAPPARLRGGVVLFMAVAAALATSAMYPLQPAMAAVAESLGRPVSSVGIALAGGPIGYLIGLALLVPLVDRFAAGRVLAAQFGVLAAALTVGAAVGHVAALGLVIGMIGACSVAGAGLSSIAGRLAPPESRATVLGVVTAGIAAGILAGRIVGGWLAAEIGWRGMLMVFAAACAVVAVSCLLVLPPTGSATTGRSYLATVRSLPGLFGRYATLRLAACRGARVAGAWTDRVGARRVILVGLVLAGLAVITMGFSLAHPVMTVICLALFDAGVFAAQVANQSTVLAIDPSSPARFNSAYMLVYFAGGSLGTAFGAAAVGWFGWSLIAVITAAAVGAAGALTARAQTA